MKFWKKIKTFDAANTGAGKLTEFAAIKMKWDISEFVEELVQHKINECTSMRPHKPAYKLAYDETADLYVFFELADKVADPMQVPRYVAKSIKVPVACLVIGDEDLDMLQAVRTWLRKVVDLKLTDGQGKALLYGEEVKLSTKHSIQKDPCLDEFVLFETKVGITPA